MLSFPFSLRSSFSFFVFGFRIVFNAPAALMYCEKQTNLNQVWFDPIQSTHSCVRGDTGV